MGLVFPGTQRSMHCRFPPCSVLTPSAHRVLRTCTVPSTFHQLRAYICSVVFQVNHPLALGRCPRFLLHPHCRYHHLFFRWFFLRCPFYFSPYLLLLHPPLLLLLLLLPVPSPLRFHVHLRLQETWRRCLQDLPHSLRGVAATLHYCHHKAFRPVESLHLYICLVS